MIAEIPDGWRLVRLSDVAEVNPKRPQLDITDTTEITFLPMAAVGENCTGILTRSHRAYGEISRGYRYFEENDVLFAKITPCLQNGKHTLATGLNAGFGFGTTEFHVVRATPNVIPGYLYRVLTRPATIDRCKSQFRGTAGQQRVHPEVLRSIPLLLPPVEEQESIVTLLDSIEQYIRKTAQIIDSAQSLKLSVTDALLEGNVRLSVPLSTSIVHKLGGSG